VVFAINYRCTEFKPLSDPGPRRLEDLDEVRDILLAVRDAGGQCVARFGCGDVVFPGDLMAQLSELVSHETGILRVDGRYHVRDLDSEARQRAEAKSSSRAPGADSIGFFGQKVKEGC